MTDGRIVERRPRGGPAVPGRIFPSEPSLAGYDVSPDGKYIALRNTSGLLELYDATFRALRRRFARVLRPSRHRHGVACEERGERLRHSSRVLHLQGVRSTRSPVLGSRALREQRY